MVTLLSGLVGGILNSIPPTLDMKLLLLVCLFSSVQSCRTVSESGVTLTGVCPNDTFIVPIGKMLDYECSATYNTGSFDLYWNISGVTVDVNTYPKPPGISVVGSGAKSTLIIMDLGDNPVLDIQCGLCNRVAVNCFNPVMFLGTESVELITFGKLSIIFDVN